MLTYNCKVQCKWEVCKPGTNSNSQYGNEPDKLYFRGIYATYLDANFVVMLGFKFVYAVFYDIYRLLFLDNRWCAFAFGVR